MYPGDRGRLRALTVPQVNRSSRVLDGQPAAIVDFRAARRSAVESRSRQDNVCVTTRDDAGPSMAGRVGCTVTATPTSTNSPCNETHELEGLSHG